MICLVTFLFSPNLPNCTKVGCFCVQQTNLIVINKNTWEQMLFRQNRIFTFYLLFAILSNLRTVKLFCALFNIKAN